MVTDLDQAAAIARAVADPELPMLSLADLGIVRSVTLEAGCVVVSVTPTYSGCPAMTEIRQEISTRLQGCGFARVVVRTQLSPHWTSDWITDAGQSKLAAAGIAPPGPAPERFPASVPLTLGPTRSGVPCPACGSLRTELLSRFGATLCRSLHRCTRCSEPFEKIKEI
jgi:ring-1,2-phenylacetyl-CoA epoxidase subunit PaaD